MKPSASEQTTTFLCAGCACLCHDIPQSDIAMSHILGGPRLEKLCSLGVEWFSEKVHDEWDRPFDKDQFEQQMDQIVALLRKSRSPLFHGGARSSVAAVRAMLALSELSRGIFDSTESEGNDWNLAVQSEGISTATWGEVRDRADVLIYLGFDPSRSLPRHLARFGLGHRHENAPNKAIRWLATVGDLLPDLGQNSQHLHVPSEAMISFLQTIRMTVRNRNGAHDRYQGGFAGVDALLQKFYQAKFVAIVVGPQLGTPPTQRSCFEQLLGFVRDANRFVRCVCVRESGKINAEGVTHVASWQSGFPTAIRFTHGYPEYDPFGATTRAALESREADFVLSVESDIAKWHSPAMQSQLAAIPHVILDHQPPADLGSQTLFVPSSIPGRDYEADFCRSDGVWISSGTPHSPRSWPLPAHVTLAQIWERYRKSG